MVPEIEQYVNAAYRAREEAAERQERAEQERRAKWVTRAGDFIEQHKLVPLLNALSIESHNPQFPDGRYIYITYAVQFPVGDRVYDGELGFGLDDVGMLWGRLRCPELGCDVQLPTSDAEIGEFFINLSCAKRQRVSISQLKEIDDAGS